jgi:hypothetical protein
MYTSLGGAISYTADVFQSSPYLEKFRAVPSIGHSRHLPNQQPAFVIKPLLSQGRHFRDFPSKLLAQRHIAEDPNLQLYLQIAV